MGGFPGARFIIISILNSYRAFFKVEAGRADRPRFKDRKKKFQMFFW